MGLRKKIKRNLETKHSQGDWHWLHWHFRNDSYSYRILVNALCECESYIPGAGIELAEEIGRIAGSERDVEHYDQILQKFCEILILKQVCSNKGLADFTWELEKVSPGTGKKVDLIGEKEKTILGIEIKAPRFTENAKLRERGPQIVTRMEPLRTVAPDATLPRDNSVKDFLISANEKFEGFKSTNTNFIGVLCIIWDDFFHEPITWLMGHSGLLTTNSFFRDENDNPVIFPNIDAIILVRHLAYFFEGIRSQNPDDGDRRLFQIGAWEGLPNVYYLLSSENNELSKLFKILNAFSHDDKRLEKAADYRPQEFINWSDIPPK